MSKVFVYLLEILLNSVIIPLMNWTNKLHQNIYRLELRKVLIENEHNNAFVEHNEVDEVDEVDKVDKVDDDSEEKLNNVSGVLSDTSDDENENTYERTKAYNFIDEKLD